MRKKFRINQLVSVVLLVVLIISLVACGNDLDDKIASEDETGEEVHLEVMCWAGSNQEVVPTEICEEYAKANENTTINVTSGQNATLYPQMVAARQETPDSPLFNVAYMNAFSTQQGITDDLWVAPDLENISNVKNILDAYAPKQGDMGICWATSPITIYYNPDKVSEPPTSWADLWNEEYKGHVAVWDNLFYSFLVPTAKVLGDDEDNMDSAFKLWSEHADQFYCFYTSVDQLKNLFISEDVWIAPFFVGMGLSWAEEGVNVEMAVLDEGTVAFPYLLQVCAGSTDVQCTEAENLINELISKENVEKFIEVSPVVPVMDGINLPDYLNDNYFFSTKCTEDAMQLDWEKCAKYNSEWKERWEQEVKAKVE